MLADDMYILALSMATVRLQVLSPGAPTTPLGQLLLAGEVLDAEPFVTKPLRVMDAFVLSVVTEGRGTYRRADGSEERIRAGSCTVILPGQPHWYGTSPGERWTELFAVFAGPLFDTLAGVRTIGTDGPVYPRPAPPVMALRAVLATTPRTATGAAHQLLALADWLLDVHASPEGAGTSPAIAEAVDLLSNELGVARSTQEVADQVGLSYDTFRRLFTKEVGQPPAAFRNARRLATAATMLRFTDMTLRQIASAVGYGDEFHLSRRFRAHFSVSPSEYRLRQVSGNR